MRKERGGTRTNESGEGTTRKKKGAERAWENPQSAQGKKQEAIFLSYFDVFIFPIFMCCSSVKAVILSARESSVKEGKKRKENKVAAWLAQGNQAKLGETARKKGDGFVFGMTLCGDEGDGMREWGARGVGAENKMNNFTHKGKIHTRTPKRIGELSRAHTELGGNKKK